MLFHISTRRIGHSDSVTFYPCHIEYPTDSEVDLPPRICAAPSIDLCWKSICMTISYRPECSGKNFTVLFVYEIDNNDLEKFSPAPVVVPDRDVTEEFCAYSSVRARLVERILIRNEFHVLGINRVALVRNYQHDEYVKEWEDNPPERSKRPERRKKLMKTKKGNWQTIIDWLGGNKFAVMVGMKDLVFAYDKDGYIGIRLKFGKNRTKANTLVVQYNKHDLYDVAFWRIGRSGASLVEEFSNVYGEDLQRVFTSVTGLQTSL